MRTPEEQLVDASLEIGKALLLAGGEVTRVEDTITRILHAYGMREICAQCPPPQTLAARIEAIRRPRTEAAWISYAGAVLTACSFAVFFGGSAADIPAAAILACLICWMDRRGFYKKANQLLFYLLCSMLTGFLGCVLVRMGVGVHLDKILIGCIMLTIPGISITYAMRDMLLGESITGLFRFIESLLIAATIAGGFLLSTVVAEGVLG